MGLSRCSPSTRAGAKNLWDPTILGVLVVLSAVGLFCGSVYLLLGTNLGARLGFLVAGACLSGFMVLLSSLWITTATPLEQPEGAAAGLEGDRGRRRPERSRRSPAVHDIVDSGDTGRRRGARATPPGDRRRARARSSADGGVEPAPQPFAQFGRSHRLPHRLRGLPDVHDRRRDQEPVLAQPAVRGASSSAPRSKHSGRGSGATGADVRPAARRSSSRSSSSTAAHCVSRRASYFFTSLVLFGLFLLGLHWYEKDARERKKAESLRPVPTS